MLSRILRTCMPALLCLSSGLMQAQSLVTESDFLVSQNTFVTGLGRRGVVDVQKSTGRVVHVYAEDHSGITTAKDIMCVIYKADNTIQAGPFRVNTTQTNDQQYPAVVVHQNNNEFYVSWSGNQAGTTDYNVYAKKISMDITDATSSTVTDGSNADVIVNTTTTGNQLLPAMAVNYTTGNNEIIIVFRDDAGADGNTIGQFYRRMSTSLASIPSYTTQIQVNGNTTGNQSGAAVDINYTNGDMVIAYHSNHNAPNGFDVWYRYYTYNSSTGYTSVTESRANNYTSGDQQTPHVQFNSSNNQFAICWSSAAQDGSGWGLYSKIYSASTTVLKDEFRVNNTSSDNQLIGKAIWEEPTRQLIYLFLNSATGFSTLKYRIYDGLTTAGQYDAVDVDKDLIAGTNTYTLYNQIYNAAYNPYTNRLHLLYDVYTSVGVFDSKVRASNLIFKHPNLTTPAFVNSTDLDRNWVHSRTYAEDGSLTGESRQYYDSLGGATQGQVRNIAANNTILAAANVKDVYNRPALQTLAAPITENLFTYKNNFITPSGASTSYHYNDFDKPVTTSNLSGEVNNPKAVNSSSLLGNYYSDNNTYEAYVGTTGYPYSRLDYNDAVIGGVQRGVMPGEAMKMGGGHEIKTIEIPVLNELDHYLALKKNHFGFSGLSATTLANQAVKTIVVDQNGIESISFSDKSGRLLASAKANGSSQTEMSGTLTTSISYFTITASSNIQISDVRISHSSDVLEIRRLCDNTLLFSGYENDFNALSLTESSCAFQIRSASPFLVSYTETQISPASVTSYVNQFSTEVTGNNTLDFYVKNPSSVSLTLNNPGSNTFHTALSIKVFNLSNGAELYSGSYSSFTNSVLPSSGFYRVQLESIPFVSNYSSTSFNLVLEFDFPYSDWAYYFYDLAGRMTASVAPKGVNISSTSLPKFKSSCTYSSRGQVLSAEDPDRGLTYYVYRKDGTRRFSQDARQRVSNKFSYQNVDYLGRVVESGEYDPALVSSGAKVFIDHRTEETGSPNSNSVHLILADISSGGGLQSAGRTQVNYVQYDYVAGDAPRTQHHLPLKVSCTYKKKFDTDASYICKTWYSYDERGRQEWMDQTLTGLGTKTIDYTFTRELLTNITYQSGTTSEKFQHKYTYDAMQRLKKVETAAGTALFQTDAQYEYYLHGPLKRKELGGNVQGLDYVYTVQGWLKSINHPELTATKDPGHDNASGSVFAKDVFGMSFDYFDGDYTRTGSNFTGTGNLGSTYAEKFNGIIRGISWQTKDQAISGNPCYYALKYDYKYQLTQADFGTKSTSTNNFAVDGSAKYKMQATYDLNGNILSLFNDKGSVADDNYSYYFGTTGSPEYTDPTANKLYVLTNSVDANDSRTYEYDEIGQMTNETKGSGAEKNVTYDAYHNVVLVENGSGTDIVEFEYNERGQRIKKTTSTIVTWYVRDAAGNEMSIYDNSAGAQAQSELPVYGAGREGVVHKNGTTTYTYEIKDHLGNVRVIVNRERLSGGTGDADVIAWMDYLPFGEVNPDRRLFPANGRRYECQGEHAEIDAETDWNSFDLRMYDARIGRWITTDPMAQHWSPYEAMGNDPVGKSDPSGGYDEGYGRTYVGAGYANSSQNGNYYTGNYNYVIGPGTMFMTSWLTTSITEVANELAGTIYSEDGEGIITWAANEIIIGGHFKRSDSNPAPVTNMGYQSSASSQGRSDFWMTHMGRDIIAMGNFFTDTKELRNLNDAISTTANIMKVVGLTMTAAELTAPVGVFIMVTAGQVSIATDGVDMVLDLAEGKYTSFGVKAGFMAVSIGTAGMIGKGVYSPVTEAVANTISDLTISGFQNTVTGQMK